MNEVNELLKGRKFLASEFRVEPRAVLKFAGLRECKVLDGGVGRDWRSIETAACAVDISVMQDDDVVVGCEFRVQLDDVKALIDGGLECGESVFRALGADSAVRLQTNFRHFCTSYLLNDL